MIMKIIFKSYLSAIIVDIQKKGVLDLTLPKVVSFIVSLKYVQIRFLIVFLRDILKSLCYFLYIKGSEAM